MVPLLANTSGLEVKRTKGGAGVKYFSSGIKRQKGSTSLKTTTKNQGKGEMYFPERKKEPGRGSADLVSVGYPGAEKGSDQRKGKRRGGS